MPIYKANGKKDGLQKYKVRVNYTDNFGEHRQLTRTAYGLEAAKDLERQLEKQTTEKEINPASNITVQQLFNEFEESNKYELREITLDKHKQVYRLHIQPLMANVRIDKIIVPVLQKWKLSIEAKGLLIETRKHIYSTFRTLLNYAVKMEYINSNPLLKIGNFKDSSGYKSEMEIYTAEQFAKFIKSAKHSAEEKQLKYNSLSEWDFYVFFNIAFYTGLRKGEIHALKWSDIENSLLTVRRSLTQKLSGEDRETPPKNKSSHRTLQIPLPLIQILEKHKKRQETLDNFSDNYRICGGERSLRDTTLKRRCVAYAESSGLKAIRIHSFRHSHVSVLANEGINIQEIARRLGHSRVEETWNTYSHLYPREEERAIEVLNKIA